MGNDLEEIKNRLDIVDFISQYVQLKKAGRNFKGLCPFHNEKTPSFMVSPEKQIWHCFGCSEGGDIFTFLMKYENIDFRDALKQLADRAGVQLKKVSPEIKKQEDQIMEIHRIAAKFFHHILLKESSGKAPLKYLQKRGLIPETIEEFEIGFAPDNWSLIARFLKSRSFSDFDIEKSGLAILKTQGGLYDRFRNRIMFPIWDISGNVIAFSGRILENSPKEIEAAKYINSPDTQIFHKNRIIYAIHKAKETIKKENLAIFVEGQMDVILTHQAGFKNVVATSGTALTPEQLQLIKKYSENIAFCFDSDSAGTAATKRAIFLAFEIGLQAQIIETANAKDPADLILKDPKLFQKAVDARKFAVDYYFEKAKKEYDFSKSLESGEKKKIAQEILPIIAHLSDAVIRGDYIKKLSQFLDINEIYLIEAAKKIQNPNLKQQISIEKELKKEIASSVQKSDLLEQRLIGMIFLAPEITKDKIEKLQLTLFANPQYFEIAKKIKLFYNKDKEKFIGKLTKILDKSQKQIIDLAVMAVENDFENKEVIPLEFEFAEKQLLARNRDLLKSEYVKKISEIEKEGKTEKLKEILKEFQDKLRG